MAKIGDWQDDTALLTFFWPVRAYIEDTDAGGIVYYVNYLKFMERARTEALRALGFGKQFILNQEAMFVVHSLQVDYKKPALLDEELRVEAHIMQLKRTSMIFRQNIYRDDAGKSELLCCASVKIACVSKDQMRPTAIPAVVVEKINLAISSQAV
ncbi:MAG: tol-pal system-associated acyl-CoA thioesterase [Pseudomonadales bacterium]|nr:tol-pal system-associated acyl-CoA thioesterase [Pseudomonadales bacterium]